MSTSSQNIALQLLKIGFFAILFATTVRPFIVKLPMIFTYVGIFNCLMCLLAYYLIQAKHFPEMDAIITLSVGFASIIPLLMISGGVSSQFAYLIPLYPLIAAEIGGIKSAVRTGVIMCLIVIVLVMKAPTLHLLSQTEETYSISKNLSTSFWLIMAILISTYFGVISQQRKKVFNQKLTFLAERDPLTEVLNRRGFNTQIEIMYKHINPEHPLSILLIDIDNFKKINDKYGHETGDLCLIALTNMLKKHIRQSDILARMGGEEFIIGLPNTKITDAQQLGEKLCHIISNTNVEAINRALTVTIGVACSDNHDHKIESIIRMADHALYEGKNTGRNKVVLYNH